MKRQISMLLIALCAWPLATMATQTAQVRLYCGSLQFERAELVTGESLDITTTLPVLNKELEPNFGSAYAHSSILRLNNYGFNPTLTGALALNVPPYTDDNTNKYPDFFEVAHGATEINTTGSFLLPMGGGTVEATWSRDAGSPTGTCQMVFTFDLPRAPLAFTHMFTLLEYKGTLEYTPGSNAVSGVVSMAQTGFPTNILQGVMQFTKPVTNPSGQLSLDAGVWTNGSAQIVGYPAASLNRVSGWPTNFSASLELGDGYPQTSAPDYRFWVISIDDTNDSDLDGIPDIADTPAVFMPRTPYLTMAMTDSNLNLTISGDVGRQHLIQESEYLSPADWQTVQIVSLLSDPQTFLLPLPSSTSRFWRVIAQ
jgi:hypothetical protein